MADFDHVINPLHEHNSSNEDSSMEIDHEAIFPPSSYITPPQSPRVLVCPPAPKKEKIDPGSILA